MTARILSRILAVSLATIVWSLVVLNAEAQQSWQPAEFPIGHWHGPPESFNTLESWQTAKDCNFTFCGPRGQGGD